MLINNSNAKKVPIIVLGLILVLAAFSLILSRKATGTQESYQFNIDTSKSLILDFKKAKIYVDEWEESYVEVNVDNLFGEYQSPNITYKDNVISLDNYQPRPASEYRINTWISLLQFDKYRKEAISTGHEMDGSSSDANHIEIRVPKNTAIALTSETVYAEKCTINASKANYASFKNCNITEDYLGEGTRIQFRNCTFAAGSVLNNENIEVRESNIEDLTIRPNDTGKSLKVCIREARGKSVKLDAKTYQDLSFEIRDSDLDLFIINSNEADGNITVRSSSIDQIENNSKLLIKNSRHQ